MDGTEQTQSNADSARGITLTDFLLARIDEDEKAARPFRNGLGNVKQWRCDEVGGNVRQVGPTDFGLPDVVSQSDTHITANHIARWGPARVLAECEAKRRIVCIVQGLGGHYEPDAARMAPEIIRHLSLPYSAHPDYRQEWKP